MIKESACKKCRREGDKLFLKGDRCFSAKCAFTKKAYAPGQHGSSFSRRPSEYGQQLREKQKVKRIYGVLEKQFRTYFEKAAKQDGVTGENLLKLLERRLDNAVYRCGFGDSRRLSRQMVSHGHIQVNGKKVSIASFLVKTGDVISFSSKFKKSPSYVLIEEKAKSNKTVQDWLKLDAKAMQVTVAKDPARDNVDAEINENLIVEYYSR
ncbi:30S ribosomal protein S4 [bacterium]|nr:30S ribosomal protein S4 [bacterium]